MTILQILDEIPSGMNTGVGDWFSRIERALDAPADWIIAIDRIGELSDEQAWRLLSWVEVAASQIVRTRSKETLVSAVFAICLVLQSELDRRDCSVVASLLARAAELSDLDFPSCVGEGCGKAGQKGREASRLLLNAPRRTPATHFESGNGDTFTFVRRPSNFNLDDLERWLDDET